MPTVFLSYSSIDSKWVDDFEKLLRSELRKRDPKIEVWRDKNKLRVGDDWNDEIEAAVRSADFFCLVASGAWAASEPCQKELATFRADPAHRTRLACAITAAADKEHLLDPIPKVHYTKFYRVVQGRNQDFAATTETFKQLVVSMAQDIVEKIKAAPVPSLTALVEEIREAVSAEITARCGTMRILSMAAPVPIDGIYTDVNILEKLTGNRELEPEAITADTLAQYGKGKVKQERVPGKVALERCPTLMILGQPGAGKTTFLKRIAMECLHGTFRPDRIPVFVPLKEFSELPGVSLPGYIRVRWSGSAKTEDLLRAGHALVLLDGLDEVADEHFKRIRDGIDQFTAEFSRCSVVLTCRIAAQKYTFPRFTEVEMANFTAEQSMAFATKWFEAKQLRHKIEPFRKKLEDKAIRELASSPLLLTMLCLLFEERPNFEGDRAELYRKAFEVLLEKWDGSRGNERPNPYQGLGVDEKENLLGEIAYQRFVQNEYLFREDSLQAQIGDFLQARPGLVAEGKKVDTEVVLNSIESQHGLLVKRSQSYYSFSHLTFQEYLTARQIQRDPNLWKQVGPSIADLRWREVLLLTVTIGKPDYAVALMKEQIEAMVANDGKIQEFLAWCSRKGAAVRADYKPAALRCFYFDIGLDLDRAFAFDLSIESARSIKVGHVVRQINGADWCTIDPDFSSEIRGDPQLSFALEPGNHIPLDHVLQRIRALQLDKRLADAALGHSGPFLVRVVQDCFDLAVAHQVPNLPEKIEALRDRLPARMTGQWWVTKGKVWRKDLRAATITCRDLGHNWEFSGYQRNLLEQYRDANGLLLDCMNAARSLTKVRRDWVEATMCLASAEIEKISRP